jgi:hypothetical protein
MSNKLTIDEQIRLLELGIEINILTDEDISRLKELGILTEDSADQTE